MDRSKKSNKNNKKFKDLKNLPCPFHKNAKHTAAECRQLQELGFYGKSNKGKGKVDNNKDGFKPRLKSGQATSTTVLTR